MAEEREYLLGTGAGELARLGFQHAVWGGYAAEAWEAAGFGLGQRILDVGCGPGYASFDLARLVGPAGHVHGIDLSARFIDHLNAEVAARSVPNVTAEVGDLATAALPAGHFHGAYARWVLCFVADPEAAVRAVARALRPGGAFAVQDYSQYAAVQIAPEHASWRPTISAIVDAWRAGGGDPGVGAQLPAMMERCGLEVTRIRPISRVGRPGTAMWSWPRTFFDNFLPGLVEAGRLTAEKLAEFDARWREWEKLPGAFFVSPPMVEVVAVKR